MKVSFKFKIDSITLLALIELAKLIIREEIIFLINKQPLN